MAPTEIISQALLLPNNFILLAVAGGVLLLSRFKKTGLVIIALCVLCLTVLSMPITAHRLISMLEPDPMIEKTQLNEAQAFVVLGGGIILDQHDSSQGKLTLHSWERLRYAAYLYSQKPLPILVTGDSGDRPGITVAELMKRELIQLFKVPVDQIIVEPLANNTAQNATYSWNILRKAGITKIVLVTNAYHMLRAKQSFERVGFTVVPAPTGFDTLDVQGISKYIPKLRYMHRSNIALHELLGMLWYSLRGAE